MFLSAPVRRWLRLWGLPGLAAGMGAMLATMAAIRLGCGCYAGGGPLVMWLALLIGLYFTAAGICALLWRLRGRDFAANAALMAIALGVIGLSFGLSAQHLYDLSRPRQAISGELVKVVRSGSRGHTEMTFTLADGRGFNWGCEWSACQGRDDILGALRWEVPIAVKMVTTGQVLVGLEVKEVQLLDPDRQSPRQAAETTGFMLLCAALFLALTVASYVALRARMDWSSGPAGRNAHKPGSGEPLAWLGRPRT